MGLSRLTIATLILLFPVLCTAQNVDLSFFGEGLFVQHPTGGIGGRGGFRVTGAIDLEAEGSYQVHSSTFTLGGQKLYYNTGYQVLAGPRLRLPLSFLHLFVTAKGGFLSSTTHPEDQTQPSFSAVKSGSVYLGGGTEIGELWGLRFDVGDEILLEHGSRLNNPRLTGGIFFRF